MPSPHARILHKGTHYTHKHISLYIWGPIFVRVVSHTLCSSKIGTYEQCSSEFTCILHSFGIGKLNIIKSVIGAWKN